MRNVAKKLTLKVCNFEEPVRITTYSQAVLYATDARLEKQALLMVSYPVLQCKLNIISGVTEAENTAAFMRLFGYIR